MDTTELARALQAATEDLDPRPGFTTEVVRGGRRRRARNRVVVATAAATVTALAGAGTYAIWLDPAPGETQVADPLTQPTRGDLAGDARFIDDVTRAWQDGTARREQAPWKSYDKLLGQPHVYWAGNTPAGPAAVVMQRATPPKPPAGSVRRHTTSPGAPDPTGPSAPAVAPPPPPEPERTVVGLIATDPADGQFKLVVFTTHGQAAFVFGPEDRTVLIVDEGTPVYLASPRYDDPAGRIVRDWRQVSFSDGVGITQLPAGYAPADLVALSRDRQPAPDDQDFSDPIFVLTASTYLKNLETGTLNSGPNPLDFFSPPVWRGPEMIRRVGGTTTPVTDPLKVFGEALRQHGALDRGMAGTAYEQWCVIAGLPDGRTAIVTERTLERLPNRLFTVLIGADGKPQTVLPGNEPSRSEALPVRVRMPDGQGWVVAGFGAQLRYKVSADGPWQDAGRDAALLPDNAVQVQVTKDGKETVVELER